MSTFQPTENTNEPELDVSNLVNLEKMTMEQLADLQMKVYLLCLKGHLWRIFPDNSFTLHFSNRSQSITFKSRAPNIVRLLVCNNI